jgi:hypothetical protein
MLTTTHGETMYQAYRPSTGAFAIAIDCLGGSDFSFNWMSWTKPNFLWMMYRSGWGTRRVHTADTA